MSATFFGHSVHIPEQHSVSRPPSAILLQTTSLSFGGFILLLINYSTNIPEGEDSKSSFTLALFKLKFLIVNSQYLDDQAIYQFFVLNLSEHTKGFKT